MKIRNLIFLFSLGLFSAVALFCIPVRAQAVKGTAPAQTKPAEEKDDYQNLVKRIKAGDLEVDFGAVRRAYTKTTDFSGYGNSGKREMFAAIKASNFKEALKLAENRLNVDYVDLNAHYVAFKAHDGLNNGEKSEFHRQIFLGLIGSIIKGRDGHTPSSAYDVISVDEEYAVISYLGFVPSSQGLAREEGHTFDLMTVTDSKTNETHKLYFNIDRFFGKF